MSCWAITTKVEDTGPRAHVSIQAHYLGQRLWIVLARQTELAFWVIVLARKPREIQRLPGHGATKVSAFLGPISSHLRGLRFAPLP